MWTHCCIICWPHVLVIRFPILHSCCSRHCYPHGYQMAPHVAYNTICNVSAAVASNPSDGSHWVSGSRHLRGGRRDRGTPVRSLGVTLARPPRGLVDRLLLASNNVKQSYRPMGDRRRLAAAPALHPRPQRLHRPKHLIDLRQIHRNATAYEALVRRAMVGDMQAVTISLPSQQAQDQIYGELGLKLLGTSPHPGVQRHTDRPPQLRRNARRPR